MTYVKKNLHFSISCFRSVPFLLQALAPTLLLPSSCFCRAPALPSSCSSPTHVSTLLLPCSCSTPQLDGLHHHQHFSWHGEGHLLWQSHPFEMQQEFPTQFSRPSSLGLSSSVIQKFDWSKHICKFYLPVWIYPVSTFQMKSLRFSAHVEKWFSDNDILNVTRLSVFFLLV